MRETNKTRDMLYVLFNKTEWLPMRKLTLAGMVSGLPFLPFPFRLDGPPRPVQPLRDVRGQPLRTERHPVVH